MLFTTALALLSPLAAAAACKRDASSRDVSRDISLDRSIQLQNTAFCLDNTDGRVEVGNRLQLYDCTQGNTNQRWEWHELEVYNGIQLYRIQLQGTDKCVAFKRPSESPSAARARAERVREW